MYYIKKSSTNKLTIKCSVIQGSILGPLLFLMHISDLAKISSLIDPIMFADENLFFIPITTFGSPSLTMNF